MPDAHPTAVLFPGQASQTAGMRDAVAAERPDLLEAAAEAVGDDPFERAGAEARERGGKAVPLRVAGAFHSPAMAPVVPEFRAALERVEFSPPRTPVVSSTTAAPFDDVRERLAGALTSPIRWRETLLRLRDEMGVRSFVA